MLFEVKKNGKSVTITINQNKFDATITPEIKGEFLVICKPQIKELIIDLSKVDYCDSGGLGALLIAERKMRENGGTVKLVGVNDKILSILKISQLDRSFIIEDKSPKSKSKHH